MKCIIKGEEIKRVEDVEAAALVNKGWAYCGKTLWKEKVRVKKPEVVAPDAAVEGETESKYKKKKKTYNKRSAEVRDQDRAEKSQERFKSKTQRSMESQGEQGNS